MSENTDQKAGPSYVVQSGATSGLTINLHPLPILSVSEHYNRARLASTNSSPKIFGALLGSQSNRDVSISNSFELIFADGDVAMDGNGGAGSSTIINADFLEQRKEQFKQVFPTLDVVGWYAVGKTPSSEDVDLHRQFSILIDTPIFLLFDPGNSTQDLPLTVYEAALESRDENGKFVQLEYGIETGEAERIAVDGVSRGGMGQSDEGLVEGNLTTQRNAIRMLYERIEVLVKYISAVMDKTAPADHSLLRQITSLVATLPTIDAAEYKAELSTEYSDVQLTSYLTSLTKQLAALSDYSDKHHTLFPGGGGDDAGQGSGRSRGGGGGGFDFRGAMRRRK